MTIQHSWNLLRSLVAASLFALCVIGGTATHAANPMLLGRWAGQADCVAIQDQYAYVGGTTNGLQILNVSNPATPVWIGGWPTNWVARGIAVSGGYACVAADTKGLMVIDVNNPAAPRRVGGYLGSGTNQLTALAVALSGNYAYVAARNSGLMVLNLTNPASPAFVTSVNAGSFAYGVTVSADGRYAYLAATTAGLQIFDLSNPANPLKVGSYTNEIIVGGVPASFQARGVAVNGRYAYIAAADVGLVILDVNDPANPIFMGYATNAPGGLAAGVAANVDFACVADKNSCALVTTGINPDQPMLEGVITNGPRGTTASVAVQGNNVFVAGGSDGLGLYRFWPSSAFTFSETFRGFGSEGGSGSLVVSNFTSYEWMAESTSNWLHTTNSGTGSGPVAYVVDPNPAGSARSGMLIIAGQPYNVFQQGTNDVPDTQAPRLDITSPANNITVTNLNLSVTGTATDSGRGNSGVGAVTVNGVRATGGSATETNTANWNATVKLTPGPNMSAGLNTITVVARDMFNNLVQQQVTVTYDPPDTLAPVLVITSPINNATVNSPNLSVNGTATDGGRGSHGVASVTVTVTGSATGGSATGGSATEANTANWSAAVTLNLGQNIITVVANDTRGNPASQQIIVNYTQAAGQAQTPNSSSDLWTIYWQNTNGTLAAWHMEGTNLTSTGAVLLTPSTIGSDWKLMAATDLNSDGRPNLLWQHQAGALGLWDMNGTELSNAPALNPGQLEPEWKIVAAPDLNGDGQSDVLWQSDSGWLAVWFMSGATTNSVSRLAPYDHVDPNWRMVGTLDINGDNQPEILWRHTDGWLGVWYMSGATMTDYGSLTPGQVHPSWKIVAAGNRNSDGKPMILWQSDSGEVCVWYMNGTALESFSWLNPGQVDPSWRIKGMLQH